MDLYPLLAMHRVSSVLVDSNLLLLYLVGLTNKDRIPLFKRTQKYTVAEFELLVRLLAIFKKIVTTPQVIAEVSTLATLYGAELIVFPADHVRSH